MLIIKESFWIICTQAIGLIATVITTKILTTGLSISDYGLFSLSLTIAGLFQLIFLNPVEQATLRFYAESLRNKYARQFSRTVFKISKKLVLAMLALAALSYGLYFHGELSLPIFLGAIVLAIGNGTISIFRSKLNSNRNRKQVTIATLLNQAPKVLLLLLIVYLGQISPSNSMWIYALCCLFPLLYMFKHIRLALSKEEDGFQSCLDERSVTSYMRPFFYWTIFSWIMTHGDRWILQEFVGPTEVGYYSFLFQISSLPVELVSAFIMNLSMPIIFSKTNKLQQNKSLALTISLFVLTSLVVGTLLTIFSKEFILLLSKDSYLIVADFVPLMFSASVLFELSQVLSIQFLTQKITSKLILPKILPAIFGLAFQFYLIPKFGFKGAVYSKLLISLTYLILIVWAIWKHKRNTKLLSQT